MATFTIHDLRFTRKWRIQKFAWRNYYWHFNGNMNASITIGAIKEFRKATWEFQATFQTPLKDLGRFVATILSTEERIEQACVIIDQIVFEPKNLNALFSGSQIQSLSKDWSLVATNKEDVQKLLRATLSDWIDFAFIPSPKSFVIYADHDEYTTFYANTKIDLNRVISALIENGFKQVANWQRHF